MRAGPRRLPGASPRAAVAAASRRRLADLAGAGGPGVRQDAVRRRVGPPPGRGRGVASDRAGGRHGGRRAGRDGRGPQRHPRRLPALGPAAVRAQQAAADLAQRGGGDHVHGRRARPAPRAAIGLRLAGRAGGVPLPGGFGQPALRPPPGRGPAALHHHDPQARPPGDRPGGRPDDGAGPGDDLREPGAPGAVVLRADRGQVRGDPARSAGAAGGAPRSERRGVVRVVRRVPPRERGGRVRAGLPGAPGDRLRGLAPRGGGLVPGAAGAVRAPSPCRIAWSRSTSRGRGSGGLRGSPCGPSTGCGRR